MEFEVLEKKLDDLEKKLTTWQKSMVQKGGIFKPRVGQGPPDDNGYYWFTDAKTGRKWKVKPGDIVEDAQAQAGVRYDTIPSPAKDRPRQITGDLNNETTFPKNILLDRRIMHEYVQEVYREWNNIPLKHTTNIEKMIIKHTNNKVSTGWHLEDPIGTIAISDGVGMNATFRHEVQHGRWWTRKHSDVVKWVEGMTRILYKHMLAPTNYAGSYGPSKEIMLQNAKKMKTVEKMDRVIKSGKITLEIFAYSDIVYYKKRIRRDLESLKRTDNPNTKSTHTMAIKHIIEQYEKCMTSFEVASIDERMYRAKLERQKLYDSITRPSEDFFNECHSEVGAYIYAKKSMKDAAANSGTWDININENVMQEAVKLYMETFGD